MADKKQIKINFTGFWNSFDKTDNFFYNLLSRHYTVKISEKPDILFFTDTATDHINYNCTKVFYTGENIRPDFMLCDFAFSYDYPVSKRNYRLPLYGLYDVKSQLNKNIDEEKILAKHTKFCCFIVSNAQCKVRNDFFFQLSKYKQVDSGGKLFNNIGGPVKDKMEFIENYKFVLAFENTSHPGYTTEKLFEPFMRNCIPIYWGDPLVANDFNTKRFINCNDYASFEEAIEQVIKIDNDNNLYMEYLRQPVFSNDELNEFVKDDNVLKRLDEIVDYHFAHKFSIRKQIRPVYFFVITKVKPRLIRLKHVTAKGVINKILKLPGK